MASCVEIWASQAGVQGSQLGMATGGLAGQGSKLGMATGELAGQGSKLGMATGGLAGQSYRGL